ncbi:MAG: hypothetical protein ABI780_12910 [Ardenticatenales bacterium]
MPGRRHRRHQTIVVAAAAALLCARALAPTSRSAVAEAQSAPNDVVTVERGGFYAVDAVAAAASDDVWAVGHDGIDHFDGASWRLITDPPGLVGSDVAVDPDGTGWAVGMGGDVAMLRDGRAIVGTLPWPAQLATVAATPTGRVWVAGDIIAVRDTAGSWQLVDRPAGGAVTALWMHTDQEGWAAAGAQLMHWDGTTWSTLATPMFRGDILGIHGTAANDVWAVGGIYGFLGWPSVRTMIHFDGRAWSTVIDDGGGSMSDVVLRASDDGWAVGQGGLMHYDGTAWSWSAGTPFNVSARSGLHGLSLADGGRLWIAGPGMLAERFRDTWDRWGGLRTTVVGGDELHLALAPGGGGWAAGREGPVVRRGPDGRWRAEAEPKDADLFQAIAAVSDDECWAAIDDSYKPASRSRVMHFRRGTWTTVDIPATEPIEEFAVLAADDVWAIAPPRRRDAARQTDFLHFDGTTWQHVATIPGAFYFFDMLSDQDGWAVGDAVLRFDPTGWHSAHLPGAPTGSFSSVDFDAGGHGWIAGSAGAFEFVGGQWFNRTTSLESLRDRTALWSLRLAPDGSVWGDASIGGAGGTSKLVHRVSGTWHVVPLGPIDGIFGNGNSNIVITGTADRYDVWIGTHLETIARVTHMGGTVRAPADRLAFLPFAAVPRR